MLVINGWLHILVTETRTTPRLYKNEAVKLKMFSLLVTRPDKEQVSVLNAKATPGMLSTLLILLEKH